MRTITFILLGLLATTLSALSMDDWKLCREHELWGIVSDHQTELRSDLHTALAAGDTLSADFYYHLLDQYKGMYGDSLSQARVTASRALSRNDFGAACNLVSIAIANPKLARTLADTLRIITEQKFIEPDEQAVFGRFALVVPDSLANTMNRQILLHFGELNPVLSDWAKEWVDEISTEPKASVRLTQIDRFLAIPVSPWKESLRSWRWNSLIAAGQAEGVAREMMAEANPSPVLQYLILRTIMDGDFSEKTPCPGKITGEADSTAWLRIAFESLTSLRKSVETAPGNQYRMFYDLWSREYFLNKLATLNTRLALLRNDTPAMSAALAELDSTAYPNNDAGEIAELHYWRGMLLKRMHRDSEALDAFARCLIAGAPRKRFDVQAWNEADALRERLGLTGDLLNILRKRLGYTGPVFDNATVTAGLDNRHESRVAWGDYDNDGRFDLLLNGNRLYHNQGDGTFADVSEALHVAGYPSNGGLWADFDRDGLLDFMTISHDRDGNGEKLMRQSSDGTFAPVNATTGNIDDHLPTEGAAWIDPDGTGFPDLYCASYENPGKFTGYPDFLWKNAKGHFTDVSAASGIRNEFNNELNAQCGRGVSPADYDNDGEQEIFVSNYRLDRDFLYDRRFGHYTDIAALEGVQGFEVNGCYGHSIGADWGDFDNDGDLDLFVANLAHPRYIAFSNKSILYRNDGFVTRHPGGTEVRFTQFTDITADSGIQYDELHSDPTWFDADNDGDLDLFITSIYENERSYLYLNDGAGHFTDVTFLAGARVYNGWGNAVADYDNDGLPDLCIGSGSGVRLLHNTTANSGKSIAYRLWFDGKTARAALADDRKKQTPNTPPYGARIELTTRDATDKTVTRIRELCSAKGTTSQNAQTLVFGIGNETPVKAVLLFHGKRSTLDLPRN
jgi:hypothetical protein